MGCYPKIPDQDYLDRNETEYYTNKSSQKLQLKQAKSIKKLPPELNMGHTLHSITDSVLLKYSDRPEKLHFHLPFKYRFQTKYKDEDPNYN